MKIDKMVYFHLGVLTILSFIAFFPLYRQTTFAPPDTYFPNVHQRQSDYYTYISYIRQGAIQLYQTNQFATDDTTKKWSHIFYLLLGRIGSILKIPATHTYHIAIFVCLILFYMYTYKLVAFLFSMTYRFLALGIIFFTGPFSPHESTFLGVPLNISSLWWTKMDMYSRLSLVPHHYFGSAMLVASAYYLLRFSREKKTRWIVRCICVQTLGTLFFPIPGFIFSLAVSAATGIICLQIIVSRNFKPHRTRALGFLLILFFAVSSLLVTNQIYSTAKTEWLDPMQWEYETHKAETFPTVFPVFILSYGILLIFLPFACMQLVKKRRFDHFFIFLLAIIPSLLYVASISGIISLNKLRFVYSAPYVFAGILATIGIIAISQYFRAPISRSIVWGIIMVLLLGNSILGLLYHWKPHTIKGKIYENTYIPNGHIRAIEFLDQNSPKYTVVMTNGVTGGFIPAFSYLTVYVGHELNTPDFWKKWETADKFFRGKLSEEDAKALLKTQKIAYVFWDFGSMPESYKSFLKPIYTENEIIIYKIRH